MKKYFIIIGLSFTVSLSVFSQAPTDSLRKQDRQQTRQHFQDQNGDGINDRMNQQQEKMKQRMDRFVDSDGDGICDHRAQGLGFRHGKTGISKGKTTINHGGKK
jgi:hypothetical protein